LPPPVQVVPSGYAGGVNLFAKPSPIAVLTPAYNRAALLPRLHQSLAAQTFRDFTWIIVDDGSTDGTRERVAGWLEEGRIHIAYSYQENAGKMAAINSGVQNCQAELVFIVDSDDLLPPDSLDAITTAWQRYGGPDCSGVIGLKAPLDSKEPVGTWMPDVNHETNYRLYSVHGFRGDAAQVYRTDILRQHPFPVAPGEKFVPEGYIWSEIDKRYRMVVLNQIIYRCEYQQDGYTANVHRNQARNPKGFMLAYRQQFEMADQLPLAKRLAKRFRYAVGLFALSFVSEPPFSLRWLRRSFWVLLWPLGYLAFVARYRTMIRSIGDN
jgi:glycosyltransferase involved in cell wall biosynthesis